MATCRRRPKRRGDGRGTTVVKSEPMMFLEPLEIGALAVVGLLFEDSRATSKDFITKSTPTQ